MKSQEKYKIYYAEGKKQGSKVYILYYSIYLKSQN